jgi:hypothetical protein
MIINYDNDFEEFLLMKEKQNIEIENSNQMQQINNQNNNQINKRKNKLSKLSNMISNNLTNTNSNKTYNETIQKIKHICEERINKNMSFSSYDFLFLLSLYVYILNEINNIQLIHDFNLFYKKYLKYKDIVKVFIDKNNYCIQHNYLLMLLRNYINNKNHTNINVNNLQYDILNKNKLHTYNKYAYLDLKNDINDMIYTLSLNNNKLIKNINDLQILENKNKKIELVNCFLDKFICTFDVGCIFNKPEIDIFNTLVNVSKCIDHIVFVAMHFVLPISYIKPLIADFLLIFNINNIIQFCIIEYDGPSHYNIKDYRICIDSIKRDMIKNEFCINNNISILRVTDKNTNYIDIIFDFILTIINYGKPVFDIPNDKHYLDLINKLNNSSL